MDEEDGRSSGEGTQISTKGMKEGTSMCHRVDATINHEARNFPPSYSSQDATKKICFGHIWNTMTVLE